MEQNQYDPYTQPGGRPPKRPMHPGVVAIAVICGTVMFLGFWFILFSQFFGGLFGAFSSGANDPNAAAALLGDTIDVIKVEGTIAEGSSTYDHKWTIETIDRLMENPNNKGLMVYVNSPGGGIYESDELYLKLKEYKEITNRPVYAYMAQTAASGGLYTCMAADKIYANRMTMTGSIGVIMSLTDTTGLQDLIGIKQDNVTSGKNKAMGNPLTDEQRAILQSMIDESYDIFVGIVAENRKLSKEEVLKLADGRVYSALQAQKLGLIDEVCGYEEALQAMKENENLSDCSVYEQQAPENVWNELFGVSSNLKPAGAAEQLDKITGYIEDNKSPKIMFYMQ